MPAYTIIVFHTKLITLDSFISIFPDAFTRNMTSAVIETHFLRWNGENVLPLQFIEQVLTDVSH